MKKIKKSIVKKNKKLILKSKIFDTNIMGVPYKTKISKQGKFYKVFDVKNKKLIEKVRIRKGLTIDKAEKKFISDKTLIKGRQRLGRNTYREFSKKNTSPEYQVVCKLTAINKKSKRAIVTYGSTLKLEYTSLANAKKDARRNAYARYMGRSKGISDDTLKPDEVKQKFSNVKFKQQFVFEKYGNYDKSSGWFYETKN